MNPYHKYISDLSIAQQKNSFERIINIGKEVEAYNRVLNRVRKWWDEVFVSNANANSESGIPQFTNCTINAGTKDEIKWARVIGCSLETGFIFSLPIQFRLAPEDSITDIGAGAGMPLFKDFNDD